MIVIVMVALCKKWVATSFRLKLDKELIGDGLKAEKIIVF